MARFIEGTAEVMVMSGVVWVDGLRGYSVQSVLEGIQRRQDKITKVVVEDSQGKREDFAYPKDAEKIVASVEASINDHARREALAKIVDTQKAVVYKWGKPEKARADVDLVVNIARAAGASEEQIQAALASVK
jgi:hypothetical protein